MGCINANAEVFLLVSELQQLLAQSAPGRTWGNSCSSRIQSSFFFSSPGSECTDSRGCCQVWGLAAFSNASRSWVANLVMVSLLNSMTCIQIHEVK